MYGEGLAALFGGSMADDEQDDTAAALAELEAEAEAEVEG